MKYPGVSTLDPVCGASRQSNRVDWTAPPAPQTAARDRPPHSAPSGDRPMLVLRMVAAVRWSRAPLSGIQPSRPSHLSQTPSLWHQEDRQGLHRVNRLKEAAKDSASRLVRMVAGQLSVDGLTALTMAWRAVSTRSAAMSDRTGRQGVEHRHLCNARMTAQREHTDADLTDVESDHRIRS